MFTRAVLWWSYLLGYRPSLRWTQLFHCVPVTNIKGVCVWGGGIAFTNSDLRKSCTFPTRRGCRYCSEKACVILFGERTMLWGFWIEIFAR